MRIGTWNLEGRWDTRHHDLITSMRCDVLLLTEVCERVDIPGMNGHLTALAMATRRRWAGVFAPDLEALPSPHGASAMALVGGIAFCSSILPWRGCTPREPWVEGNTATKTVAAVDDIAAQRPSVWGGDWNHALSGREWSGSIAGRTHLLATLDRLGLQVPTATSPHRIEGLLSIDHVAVPEEWTIRSVERLVAAVDGVRISDHDAYVVGVGN